MDIAAAREMQKALASVADDAIAETRELRARSPAGSRRLLQEKARRGGTRGRGGEQINSPSRSISTGHGGSSSGTFAPRDAPPPPPVAEVQHAKLEDVYL